MQIREFVEPAPVAARRAPSYPALMFSSPPSAHSAGSTADGVLAPVFSRPSQYRRQTVARRSRP
jgi:hypothetical protein